MKVVHGKRTSIEIVASYATERDGHLLSDVYKNILTTLKWQCAKGHIFETTFNHVKNRGQWCPECGRKKGLASMRKRFKEDISVRERIRAAHWQRNGISSKEQLKNKKKVNKSKRFLFRLKTDIQERIKHNIRVRTRMALKGKSKTDSVTDSLGCSWLFLRGHLELLFQPGMTWANYGNWHIDHIMPLSRFDLTVPEQFKKACHYTNLQPLWAVDNIRKGNRI